LRLATAPLSGRGCPDYDPDKDYCQEQKENICDQTKRSAGARHDAMKDQQLTVFWDAIEPSRAQTANMRACAEVMTAIREPSRPGG
jgi:hypothetical protein